MRKTPDCRLQRLSARARCVPIVGSEVLDDVSKGCVSSVTPRGFRAFSGTRAALWAHGARRRRPQGVVSPAALESHADQPVAVPLPGSPLRRTARPRPVPLCAAARADRLVGGVRGGRGTARRAQRHSGTFARVSRGGTGASSGEAKASRTLPKLSRGGTKASPQRHKGLLDPPKGVTRWHKGLPAAAQRPPGPSQRSPGPHKGLLTLPKVSWTTQRSHGPHKDECFP